MSAKPVISNSLFILLFICIDLIYMNWSWLMQILDRESMNLFAKIIATGIVMVYNFVTRKIFLEKKTDVLSL